MFGIIFLMSTFKILQSKMNIWIPKIIFEIWSKKNWYHASNIDAWRQIFDAAHQQIFDAVHQIFYWLHQNVTSVKMWSPKSNFDVLNVSHHYVITTWPTWLVKWLYFFENKKAIHCSFQLLTAIAWIPPMIWHDTTSTNHLKTKGL